MPDYKEQIEQIIDAEAHERVWDKLADVCIEEEHDVERIIARLDAKMGEENTNFLVFALFVYLTKHERMPVYGRPAEEDAELVPCAYSELDGTNEIAWYTSAETDDFVVMPGYSENRRK